MSEPIKSGDECIVIAGLGRHKSPNVGKRVVVGQARGEHSRYGRMWRCEGDGIVQYNDGGGYDVLGWADFPAAWLQKADPIAPGATRTKEELTV